MIAKSTQILHKGQHLLRHKAQDVGYVNATSPSDNTVKKALDNIYASLGTVLSWQTPVANKAALPLTGNSINDARMVQDDGDGKPSVYACIAIIGTVDQQWQKIADVDWGVTVVTSFADEAFIDLPDATCGWGYVMVGDNEEFARFRWSTSGEVFLDENTANVVDSDTDTKFCIFDNGTSVRVKNRLGSSKLLKYLINY
jgi:hypothetical protein